MPLGTDGYLLCQPTALVLNIGQGKIKPMQTHYPGVPLQFCLRLVNGMRYLFLECEHFFQSASTGKGTSHFSYPCVIQQIGTHVSALPKAFCQTAAVVTDQLPKFSPSELLAARRSDPCMQEVLFAVQQHKTADSIHLDHPDLRLFKREWDKLSVEQELQCRTLKLSDGHIRKQLVLPKQFHSFVLKSLRD